MCPHCGHVSVDSNCKKLFTGFLVLAQQFVLAVGSVAIGSPVRALEFEAEGEISIAVLLRRWELM